MPRTPTLLLSVLLSAGCASAARAQSGVRPQAAPPAQEGEEKPRPSADADTLEAEQLCERAESLAAAGRAEERAALDAYGRALKLYLTTFIRERPAAPGARPETTFRESMRARLRRAPQCVEGYLRLGGGATAFERSQLEAFRGQALLFVETDESRAAFLGSELDQRARIERKPEPGFPEGARGRLSQGTVRLRAVLASDGTVRHVFVLKGVPYGFSELCVDAARRIKFTPAVRNGSPVSQFVTLEYHFRTY
jgi:TonB family protein